MIDFEGSGPARRSGGELEVAPVGRDHRAELGERGERGAETETQTAGKPGTTIGDDGPAPSLQIRNSFEDDLPAIVSMQFFWEPARRG